MRKWTEEELETLRSQYPLKGLKWCAEHLQRTFGSVRQKASDLGLRSRCISDAWHQGQKQAALTRTGRKRPEQSLVIKRTLAEGKMVLNEAQRKALGERTKERHRLHGHPKGMLGKKHTKETKEKISLASQNWWQSLTEAEKDKHIMSAIRARKTVAPRVGGTWKGAWREIGGKRKFFRSRWEANYARYLEWLKQRGEIKEWMHEPKTFWFDGIKRGCVSYLPDFCVTENDDSEVYHEVKGWMDARSKTKIKRMAKYHPNVKLVLIQKKEYESIARIVGGMIADWE